MMFIINVEVKSVKLLSVPKDFRRRDLHTHVNKNERAFILINNLIGLVIVLRWIAIAMTVI